MSNKDILAVCRRNNIKVLVHNNSYNYAVIDGKPPIKFPATPSDHRALRYFYSNVRKHWGMELDPGRAQQAKAKERKVIMKKSTNDNREIITYRKKEKLYDVSFEILKTAEVTISCSEDLTLEDLQASKGALRHIMKSKNIMERFKLDDDITISIKESDSDVADLMFGIQCAPASKPVDWYSANNNTEAA